MADDSITGNESKKRPGNPQDSMKPARQGLLSGERNKRRQGRLNCHIGSQHHGNNKHHICSQLTRNIEALALIAPPRHTVKLGHLKKICRNP